jgi:hypothetical protein
MPAQKIALENNLSEISGQARPYLRSEIEVE